MRRSEHGAPLADNSIDVEMPHDQTMRSSLPQTARDMLAAMAGIYKYSLSDFEVMMWEGQVFTQYPDAVVMRALLAHMESGKSDANFFPRYGNIKAILEPAGGFIDIANAVRAGSPYVPPNLQDPILVEAIHQLGGWAMVCEEMPDARERPIDFDRYAKRVDAAITAARNTVQIQGKQPLSLVGLGQSRPQPLERSRPLQLNMERASSHAPVPGGLDVAPAQNKSLAGRLPAERSQNYEAAPAPAGSRFQFGAKR